MIRMTRDEYHAHDEEMNGLCLGCGWEQSACEPDARMYECENCGLNQVYGVPELLIMGRILITD